MSGRSGYVRVEQATRSQQNFQKTAQVPKFHAAIPASGTFISGLFYPTGDQSINTSIHYKDSGVDHQGQNFIPTGERAIIHTVTLPKESLPSKQQKSPFRTKIDEKTIKCRNEIKRAFRIKSDKNTKGKSVVGQAGQTDPKKNTEFQQTCRLDYENICSHLRTQNYSIDSSYLQLPSLPTQFRRWQGSGRPTEFWAKLRKDPELFDSFGDTLVYFCDPQKNFPFLEPSLRINSRFIKATNSVILINMLQKSSSGERLRAQPNEVGTIRTQPSLQNCRFDDQVSYEILIPTPYGLSKTDFQRHQVTTRNIFALLLNASLVGLTMYQALSDLEDRIKEYMPSNTYPAGIIIDWIKSRGIDDPRYDLSTSFSLLAWSEGDYVHWEEGWREAFCHAVGMRALKADQKFEHIPEFRYLSPITKTLLSRFSMDTRLLVQECQYRLDTFDFNDMWDVVDQGISTARSAFDRLRQFLVQHYQKIYGCWPPTISDGKENWLTRTVAKKLSHDFGALYDYLVNRTISWEYKQCTGRKLNMKCATNESFDPDTKQLPITEILISFDDRMEYPHIPFPYCLTPEPIVSRSNSKSVKRVAKSIRKQEEIMQERHAAIAYQDSTNIYILGSDFVSNDLVEAFTDFENEERFIDDDLYNSRRGRWVLIYGILQILASISVDTPQLRFTENVDYHLQCSLRGTPPWIGVSQNQLKAEHTHSHCWQAPSRWRSFQSTTTCSRSGLSSCPYTTPVKTNTHSACGSLNGYSSSSPTSSDADFSLQSSTLTNITISPDLESKNFFIGCNSVDPDKNLEEINFFNRGLRYDQPSVSTSRSLDSFASSMKNPVVPPLPLRSSRLRHVKNSIRLSPKVDTHILFPHQNSETE